MISETTLMTCENVPPVMEGCFDVPWYFVGEIRERWHHLPAICKKCEERRAGVWRLLEKSPVDRETFKYVGMQGYLFVTDDMIECVIYFGTCGCCGAVHWARQGPPFARARCYSWAD